MTLNVIIPHLRTLFYISWSPPFILKHIKWGGMMSRLIFPYPSLSSSRLCPEVGRLRLFMTVYYADYCIGSGNLPYHPEGIPVTSNTASVMYSRVSRPRIA